jgi:DNA polymerase III subunit alpha
LASLSKMGFAGYFLVVADIINYARKKHIPGGAGRGSAAGSLVAYSLGITDLDPLAYGLIFERFLNPERQPSRHRHGLLLRAPGGDHPLRGQDLRLGKRRPNHHLRQHEDPAGHPGRGPGPGGALRRSGQNRQAGAGAAEDHRGQGPGAGAAPSGIPGHQSHGGKDILTVAQALEGLPRHASTHAAGLVIADRPLVEYLPLYKGAKGELVTQFDMKGVERVGLVKFDFLGLRTLTVIDQAVRFIRQSHDAAFDIHAIPLNDPETFALLQAGNTAGVFQLESDGMRALMVRLKPTTLEDIIALVALYRPGPMESGMLEDFVRRKHGEEPVTYLLPELEPFCRKPMGSFCIRSR